MNLSLEVWGVESTATSLQSTQRTQHNTVREVNICIGVGAKANRDSPRHGYIRSMTVLLKNLLL